MKVVFTIILLLFSSTLLGQKKPETIRFYGSLKDDTIQNICAPYSCYSTAVDIVKSEWNVSTTHSTSWKLSGKQEKKFAKWNAKSNKEMVKRHGENWRQAFTDSLLKENGNHTEVIFGIREVEEYSELVRLAEANNKYYLIVNIYKNTNGTYKIYVDINELLGSKFSRKRCMELLFRLGDEKAELLTDIESNYLPLYAPE